VILLLGFFSTAQAADHLQLNQHDENGALVTKLDSDSKPDNPGQGGGQGNDDDDDYFIENTRLNDWPEHEKNWFAKATRLANGDLGMIWAASFSIYYDGRYLMFARSSDEGDTWSYSLVADVSEAVLGEVYNIWRPHLCEMPDGALGTVTIGPEQRTETRCTSSDRTMVGRPGPLRTNSTFPFPTIRILPTTPLKS
jgi:hypothetical protein